MRSYSDILGSVDSAFYYVEQPETPMNLGALTIFEGTMDFDVFIKYVEARLANAPRYRERIVQAPLRLGQPTWIADPHFYIGDHVMRVRVPGEGTEAELQGFAGQLVARTLDRAHPLWEIYFIEGLKGRTALLFKVHHCMVDGLAAVELFTFLTDFTPSYTPPPPAPPHNAPRLPEQTDLLLDSLRRDVDHHLKLFRKLGTESLKMFGQLTDDTRRLKMLVALVHLINNNLRPIKKLPINGKNTGRQILVWSEFPLEAIHAIRATRRASVNEVMLTMLARAVQRYTDKRGGSDQRFLRALVPVNVRHGEEKGDYGNRISVLPIDLPFHVDDPLDNLEEVRRNSLVMKESGLALTMDLVLTLPALMPSIMQKPIWDLTPGAFALLAHTWCTNVASPPIPVYLLGHEMQHVFGFFPLNPSMGLASVIVSYNGHITMTLVMDEGIVREPQALGEYLREAFRDLCRAAGVKVGEPVRSGEEAMPAPVAQANGAMQQKPEAVALPVTPAEPAAPTSVRQNGRAPTRKKSSASAPPSEPKRPRKAAAKTTPALNTDAPASVIQAAADIVEHTLTVVEEEVRAPEPPLTPESEAASAPVIEAGPPKLFSESWAQALREEINHSPAYRDASTGWTAGSLALVIEASPAHGFAQPAAVWLDLYRGVCRGARALSLDAAKRDADFVIQGSYEAWMDALHGRMAPLIMLTTGRLQLKKGLLLRLLPFTRSANELVGCAQRVPWS